MGQTSEKYSTETNENSQQDNGSNDTYSDNGTPQEMTTGPPPLTDELNSISMPQEEKSLDIEEVVFARYPSELISFELAELQDLCRENHISVIAKNKYELMGRLLIVFPPEAITEDDLQRLEEKDLRKMATGAYISNKGKKSDIIRRLIKYGTKSSIEPPTPQRPGENRESRKLGRVTITDRVDPLTLATEEPATSRKRKLSDTESLPPKKNSN